MHEHTAAEFVLNPELMAALRAMFNCPTCYGPWHGDRRPSRCTHVTPEQRRLLDEFWARRPLQAIADGMTEHRCPYCEYEGATRQTLGRHIGVKHPKESSSVGVTQRGVRDQWPRKRRGAK